jgi:ABC-type Zn uptake system ZnuABC Zn-binding protein ZnuA
VKIYRIVRWVILIALILAAFLLIKKPEPVAKPQDAATVAANAQSYQTKLQQLEQEKNRDSVRPRCI